jgi:RecA-family ATPase
MAEFCNYFDRIAKDCGCAIVYCHHHSKGGQGDKRSMDRASGSGVFARDPDAMIDLLPLDAKDAKTQYMQSFECEAIKKAADEQDYTDEWRQKVSADDMMVPNRLIADLEQMFSPEQMAEVYKAREAVKKQFESVTGWRASFTLREFASPSPQNLWFRYPIHDFDDGELLSDCTPEGETEQKSWKKKKDKPQKINKLIEFKNTIEFNPDETWTVSKVKDRFKVADRTVWNWLKQLNWTTKLGVILPEGKDIKQDEVPF